jgi:hypothetical protein
MPEMATLIYYVKCRLNGLCVEWQLEEEPNFVGKVSIEKGTGHAGFKGGKRN